METDMARQVTLGPSSDGQLIGAIDKMVGIAFWKYGAARRATDACPEIARGT